MPFNQLKIIDDYPNFIKFKFGSSSLSKIGSFFYFSFFLIWGIMVLLAVSRFGAIAIGMGGMILSILGIAAIYALTIAIKELKKTFTTHFIEITDSHLYYNACFFTKNIREVRFYLPQVDCKTIDNDKSKDLLFTNLKTNQELLLQDLSQEDQDVIIHQIEHFKRGLE